MPTCFVVPVPAKEMIQAMHCTLDTCLDNWLSVVAAVAVKAMASMFDEVYPLNPKHSKKADPSHYPLAVYSQMQTCQNEL